MNLYIRAGIRRIMAALVVLALVPTLTWLYIRRFPSPAADVQAPKGVGQVVLPAEQQMAKEMADAGVMSVSDYVRLAGIALKIERHQAVTDGDLVWTKQCLESAPPKDRLLNRNQRHMSIALCLSERGVWKGGQALRLLAMARYLLEQNNHFDSISAEMLLGVLPKSEAREPLGRLAESRDVDVRDYARRELKGLRHSLW
jgi:hypothetical protein